MKQELKNPRRQDGKVIYDCVQFGRYPQADGTGKTVNPIKWRVLNVQGNVALLHADQNLDVMYYHNTDLNMIYWKNSFLREWLNQTFMNRAFTKNEQTAIIPRPIAPDTKIQDKISLLSCDDSMNTKYGFSPFANVTDYTRRRTNTAYVAAGGSINSDFMYGEGASDTWLLKSPGNFSGTIYADVVCNDGSVSHNGTSIHSKSHAICPALWIDLNSDLCIYAGTTEIKALEYDPENYLFGSEIELADIQMVEDAIERKIAHLRKKEPCAENDIKELETTLRVLSDLYTDLDAFNLV